MKANTMRLLLLVLAFPANHVVGEDVLSSSPSGVQPSENFSVPPTQKPAIEEEHKNHGEKNCPCLTMEEANLPSLAAFQPPCLNFIDKAKTFCFPDTYGAELCSAHSDGLEPFCDDPLQFPGNPDWCSQPWCWVDPHNCQGSAFHLSQFFPDASLYYSYDTCGGSNTFAAWAGSNTTEHSFTDLVGLIERYLVSAKTTLEDQAPRIESFVSSKSPQEIAAECSPLPPCDSCPECRSEGVCWDREVDLDATTTILSPANRRATSPDELHTLECQTNTLSRSLLQVSGREYNDVNRIAFAHFGDQNTGGLVQWPAIADTCVPDYDARFRPWYASALSGSKDVVMVIDVSGSMTGNRIFLAAEAAKAVVRTLTWVDYFNIITFNDDVASVYANSLQRATEDRVAHAMKWINSAVQPGGGTNFLAPLQRAYQILSQPPEENVDEPPRCSQAILFLTDGEDQFFAANDLEQERNDNPDVVVFTYSLGSDAATDVLHDLACASNGIFHRVNNANTLPDVMAGYYEYFVQLQDTCHITWIKYTGAFTGEEFITGCTAVFHYGNDNEESLEGQSSSSSLPEVLGVTCIDLNLIVDLDTLRSCTSGGFDAFVEVVRREAQQCSSRVMDPCVLAHLRERAGSTCANSPIDAGTCILPPQPMESDCTNLDPSRFKDIPLSGCSTTDANVKCSKNENNNDNEENGNGNANSNGNGNGNGNGNVIILVVVAVVVVIIVALVCACWWKKGKKATACNAPSGSRRKPTRGGFPSNSGNSAPSRKHIHAAESVPTQESVGIFPDGLHVLPPPTAPPATDGPPETA